MTKPEAAEYLGVSTRQIEKYATEGKLSTTYTRSETGRKIADFSLSELDRIKEEQNKAYTPRRAAAQLVTESPEQGAGDMVPIGQAGGAAMSQFLASMEALPAVLAAIQQRPAVAVSDKLLLTLEDAQLLTGLSRDRLREAIKAGGLAGKQIGKAIRIKRSDLEAYIESL